MGLQWKSYPFLLQKHRVCFPLFLRYLRNVKNVVVCKQAYKLLPILTKIIVFFCVLGKIVVSLWQS